MEGDYRVGVCGRVSIVGFQELNKLIYTVDTNCWLLPVRISAWSSHARRMQTIVLLQCMHSGWARQLPLSPRKQGRKLTKARQQIEMR